MDWANQPGAGGDPVPVARPSSTPGASDTYWDFDGAGWRWSPANVGGYTYPAYAKTGRPLTEYTKVPGSDWYGQAHMDWSSDPIGFGWESPEVFFADNPGTSALQPGQTIPWYIKGVGRAEMTTHPKWIADGWPDPQTYPRETWWRDGSTQNPEPYFEPAPGGSPIARPFPRHTPPEVGFVPPSYRQIPHKVPDPYRSAHEQLEWGPLPEGPTRGPDKSERPAEEPGTVRSRKPPGIGVKERKLKKQGVVNLLVGGTTEAIDLINALYSALPKQCKPGYYQLRNRTGGTFWVRRWKANQWQRARAVYECFDHMDIQAAVTAIINDQIEDYLYGRLGRAAGQAAWNSRGLHGMNRGFETGQWDTYASDMINQYLQQRNQSMQGPPIPQLPVGYSGSFHDWHSRVTGRTPTQPPKWQEWFLTQRSGWAEFQRFLRQDAAKRRRIEARDRRRRG